MTFWTFLQHGGQTAQGLTEGLAARFTELMARGHSVADLLGHYGDEFGHLPAEQLHTLSRAHRAWKLWLRRSQKLAVARKSAKLPELPPEVLASAVTPDQLDAVARCARLCPRSAADNPDQWAVMLHAGLQLWRAAVGTARKHAAVRCAATDLESPDNAQFEAYVRDSDSLDDIAAHRWLAMRRGARQGVLTLTLELPREQLAKQAELYRPQLARGPAAERTAESLLEELVLDDIEPWLLSILDGEAEDRAVQAACQSLTGLLRAAPVQARRVGALNFGRPRAAAAAVVADRDGELLAQRALKPEGNWLTKAIELFEQHKVHQVVVPASAPSAELTAAVDKKLDEAGIQVHRVRTAALAEARLPLTDPPARLGASVASALVLARRALDPIKAWAAVDPVSIGVAEYQNDLDQDRLRAALQDTVEICKLERRRGSRPSTNGPPPARGTGAMARLNPMVKSIADLRPGMAVHGVVTNISHFGAFISLGLPQEALVHISELSDDFVSNPNDVVSIGQQITAHVLSCDPSRGRISLSMKSRARLVAQSRDGSKAGGGDKTQRAPPRSRAEALADLERLFKK